MFSGRWCFQDVCFLSELLMGNTSSTSEVPKNHPDQEGTLWQGAVGVSATVN